MNRVFYCRYLKRLLDIFFSLLGLLLLAPVLLVLSICIVFSMGFPVFFFQEMVGKDCEVFNVIKFRSMNDRRDKEGNLLSNKERLTKLGVFIRKFSLDELPQLLNVLKGDMSLIGPRPLYKVYLPYYTENESRRHSVRPGITGWAQVNGRNHLDWDTRLAMDIYYVDQLSLCLDVEIFFITVLKVLKSGDVVVALDPRVNIPLNEYRKNAVKKA